MNIPKIVLWLVIADLVALNLGFVYVLVKPEPGVNMVATSSNDGSIPEITCGDDCKAEIGRQVAILENNIKADNAMAGQSASPVPSPEPTLKAKAIITPVKKTRTISYVSIPGSGQVKTNDWANVSGTEFYFDTADYPGLKEIYFEGAISLVNGNGMAYVRLFDATHGIGVQGSEISTNKQTNTLTESGQVSFWRGKNLIKVQAKSLTADTAVYSWGRLKIATEQ